MNLSNKISVNWLRYFVISIVVAELCMLTACKRNIFLSRPSQTIDGGSQGTISECSGCIDEVVRDFAFKLVDLPLPLQIVDIEQTSALQKGQGLYLVLRVIGSSEQLVSFYRKEMERYGWYALTAFSSQDPPHTLIVFEKPNNSRAIIIILQEKIDVPVVSVKIYRIASSSL